MAEIIINIADGAEFSQTLDQTTGVVTQRGVKIARVSGFTGETNAAEAAAYAMGAIMAVNPMGFPYASQYPMCRCVSAVVTGQTSDSVSIRLGFSTPDPNANSGGSGGNPWTIASTGRGVTEVTEFALIGKPLLLKWENPNNKEEKFTRVGRLNYDVTWRGYTCTATLPLSKVEMLEDSSDLVNDSEWSGKPKGHWRILDVNSTRPIGSKYATVSVTVLSRRAKSKLQTAFAGDQGRDWGEYLILENPNTNRPIVLEDKVVKQLLSAPYDITPLIGNGIMKVGPYLPASFTDIFGVSDIRKV